MQPFGHNTWAEKWGLLVPPILGGGVSWELGPHLTQCGLGRGLYLPIKWHLDPSSRLATTDMGQKLGLSLLGKGSCECDPIQHNVAGVKAYLCAKFHHDLSNRLATIHQRSMQTDRTTGR